MSHHNIICIVLLLLIFVTFIFGQNDGSNFNERETVQSMVKKTTKRPKPTNKPNTKSTLPPKEEKENDDKDDKNPKDKDGIMRGITDIKISDRQLSQERVNNPLRQERSSQSYDSDDTDFDCQLWKMDDEGDKDCCVTGKIQSYQIKGNEVILKCRASIHNPKGRFVTFDCFRCCIDDLYGDNCLITYNSIQTVAPDGNAVLECVYDRSDSAQNDKDGCDSDDDSDNDSDDDDSNTSTTEETETESDDDTQQSSTTEESDSRREQSDNTADTTEEDNDSDATTDSNDGSSESTPDPDRYTTISRNKKGSAASNRLIDSEEKKQNDEDDKKKDEEEINENPNRGQNKEKNDKDKDDDNKNDDNELPQGVGTN